MKVVLATDWHADWTTDGFDRSGDLLKALEPVMEEALKADAFVFLGDLSNPFSKNVHVAVNVAVMVATDLSNAGVDNYWLTGNHDVYEAGKKPAHTLLALKAMRGRTKVFDEPISMLLAPGKRIIALPFTSAVHNYSPEVFVRECHTITQEFDEKVLIAGHLNIEGIEPGSESTDMARGRDVFWPEAAVDECYPNAVCVNGHYHTRQKFRRIYLPGSLLRLTHGEEKNYPSFLVMHL